jgi:hypothetical protein
MLYPIEATTIMNGVLGSFVSYWRSLLPACQNLVLHGIAWLGKRPVDLLVEKGAARRHSRCRPPVAGALRFGILPATVVRRLNLVDAWTPPHGCCAAHRDVWHTSTRLDDMKARNLDEETAISFE